MSTATTVAVTHPERTSDPRTVRWHIDGHTLSSDPMPAPLRTLLEDEVADSVLIRPGRVLVTLAEGLTWSEHGSRVRDAVLAAVRDGGQDGGSALSAAMLTEVAAEIIDDLITPVASAHAGSIDLIDATTDTVRVRLSGACRHCPLSTLTVQGRLEGELRRRLPDQVVRVVQVNGGNRISRIRNPLRTRPPVGRPRPPDR